MKDTHRPSWGSLPWKGKKPCSVDQSPYGEQIYGRVLGGVQNSSCTVERGRSEGKVVGNGLM